MATTTRSQSVMTSLEKLVPQGCLHMRPLQVSLSYQWHQVSKSQDVKVTPSKEAIQALKWWMNRSHLEAGVLCPRHP